MINRLSFVLLVGVLIGLSQSPVYAQDCQTLKITAPAYLLLDNKAVHIEQDTSIVVCQQYVLLTENNGYNFYKKLIKASNKNIFLKEIYKMALASPPPDTVLEKQNMIKAEDVYQAFEGRPISKIKIQVLKPFGPTIADTNRPVVTFVEKALNPTHVNTRDYIIRNKLLFDVHDTINPMLMVENARILTNLNYLQDASIVVSPAEGDSVDVLVLVKDKFPWLVVPNIYSATKYSLYAKQANILGTGQGLGLGLTLDTKSKPVFYLSEVGYYINNLYKQIDLMTAYQISESSQKTQLRLDRQLVPTKVNLSGGLEISQTLENMVADPTNIDKSQYFFKYMYYDVWASYLFTLQSIFPQINNKNIYLIPGLRLSKKNYSDRPVVSPDTNSRYYNYDYILGNVVVASQDYYRTNYLLKFGQAEFLPYGFQVNLTGGYSWTEFMQKPYIGAGFSFTSHQTHLGFIFARLDVGTHFTEAFEQGAFNLNLIHLTDLIVRNKSKYRVLTQLNLTTGINRFSNDLLYINDNYGFFGLDKETFYGEERIFLESTFVNYTSWYLFGFRIALEGFASIGTIGPQDIKLGNRQLISSIGAGLYVRNDFLAFDAFEVKIAYFPVTPAGVSHFGFSLASKELFSKLNFLFTQPRQAAYN
ncbi:MAG: hypothetical protein K9G61_11725 [Bacteroidales bacterium]|nr:hypothetical protein [Bacteroidales bacterium]